MPTFGNGFFRYQVCFSTPNPEPLDRLHCLVSQYLPGYAILPCSGAWEGKAEHAYTITVVGTLEDESIVLALAKDIKYVYQQDKVLVDRFPVNSVLV